LDAHPEPSLFGVSAPAGNRSTNEEQANKKATAASHAAAHTSWRRRQLMTWHAEHTQNVWKLIENFPQQLLGPMTSLK
jgi:hypothetical protein